MSKGLTQEYETYSKVEDDKIGSSDSCKMFMGTSRLNDSLGRERDQSDSETLQDLNNDDLGSGVCTLPESNHQPISKSLNRESQDQSWLQPPEVSNENRSNDSDNGGRETWDGSKSTCGEVRLVTSDKEESIEVSVYDSTRHRMEEGDEETSDNVFVLEEVEGN